MNRTERQLFDLQQQLVLLAPRLGPRSVREREKQRLKGEQAALKLQTQLDAIAVRRKAKKVVGPKNKPKAQSLLTDEEAAHVASLKKALKACDTFLQAHHETQRPKGYGNGPSSSSKKRATGLSTTPRVPRTPVMDGVLANRPRRPVRSFGTPEEVRAYRQKTYGRGAQERR